MKKYAFLFTFIFISANCTMAQLMLIKLESKHKTTFSTGSLIEIKLQSTTSRDDSKYFESYKGHLEYADKDSALIRIMEVRREYMDDHKASIREFNIYSNIQKNTHMRIPLANVLSINRYKKDYWVRQNRGIIFCSLAVLSNLFIAPNIKQPTDRIVRNGGYVVIGIGLAMAVFPKYTTYYLAQPKKNMKKTLWKLDN
jgi:hypothetical protein